MPIPEIFSLSNEAANFFAASSFKSAIISESKLSNLAIAEEANLPIPPLPPKIKIRIF